jgi:hypothetical protein
MKHDIDIDRIIAACEDDDYTGFCTACGAEQGGCEPDARMYICESCEQPSVYGAEELLFMTIEDGRDGPIDC